MQRYIIIVPTAIPSKEYIIFPTTDPSKKLFEEVGIGNLNIFSSTVSFLHLVCNWMIPTVLDAGE